MQVGSGSRSPSSVQKPWTPLRHLRYAREQPFGAEPGPAPQPRRSAAARRNAVKRLVRSWRAHPPILKGRTQRL